jgi:hypothetical protein
MQKLTYKMIDAQLSYNRLLKQGLPHPTCLLTDHTGCGMERMYHVTCWSDQYTASVLGTHTLCMFIYTYIYSSSSNKQQQQQQRHTAAAPAIPPVLFCDGYCYGFVTPVLHIYLLVHPSGWGACVCPHCCIHVVEFLGTKRTRLWYIVVSVVITQSGNAFPCLQVRTLLLLLTYCLALCLRHFRVTDARNFGTCIALVLQMACLPASCCICCRSPVIPLAYKHP